MSGRLGMTGSTSGRGDRAVGLAMLEVEKSFVPGRGFVPASQVPKGQLRQLAHGGRKDAQWASADKEHQHWSAVRGDLKDKQEFRRRNPVPDSPTKTIRPRVLSRSSMDKEGVPENVAAFAFKTGGRRAKGTVYARPGATHETRVHEQQHVNPKRSGYRLFQVTSSPRLRMREEARADYLSGSRYKTPSPTNSGYADAARGTEAQRKGYEFQNGKIMNRPSLTNYRHVQDRMEAAGTKSKLRKVDTSMSDREARRLATQYDTRGPLPKGLDRETKMKAYEARYIASGGKQGERWKRRADNAETTRNIGLAGATLSAGALLATRGKKTGPKMARAKITPHRAETGALASGLLGGAAELYGEHARDRRASYSNTPAGVAGSALSRMRAYTPGGQK